MQMFGSSILAVILGLIFVYFVFSMIVSKVNEAVAAKLAWRARDFEKWLKKTLDPPDGDPPVSSKSFKQSTLITSITREGAKHDLPSYIAPGTFSLAILDLLASGDKQVKTVEEVQQAVANLPPNHPLKAPLARLAIEAGNDLAALRLGIEGWFNDSMQRVGGWYKRRVQRWLLVYALAATVLLNVDTIAIARVLWTQQAVQDAVVAQAARQTATGTPTQDSGTQVGDLNGISTRVAEVKRLNLPIGWAPEKKDGRANPDPRRWPGRSPDLVVKLLGLALTVGALSLGAPFWFDLLNKISKLRSAGDRPSTDPPPDPASPPVLVIQHEAAPPAAEKPGGPK